MRLLCIYRHYWPDITPYARLLKTITERLTDDGHEVTVLTAQPGYNDVKQEKQPWRETLGGVDVVRYWLPPERKRFVVMRFLGFAVFLFRSFLHALWNRKKYDAVLFNVHPPFMMGATGLAIRYIAGLPYVYHCQDIHPESSLIAKRMRQGVPYRILRWLDTRVCRSARRNIVLSEDMRDTLVERGVQPKQITVLNNFRLSVHFDGSESVPALLTGDSGCFTVLFAGNIGNFQGLDAVVEAAKLLSDNTGIRFVFMGEGSAKNRLTTAAGDMVGRTVFFLPQCSVEVAFASMEQADLGLVTLAPDVYRVAYPSKTMMYLAAGCPILTVIEPESNLAATVQDNQLGYVCGTRGASAIADAIRVAYKDRAKWDAVERDRLRSACDATVGVEQVLNRWSRLAEDCFASDDSPVQVANNRSADVPGSVPEMTHSGTEG